MLGHENPYANGLLQQMGLGGVNRQNDYLNALTQQNAYQPGGITPMPEPTKQSCRIITGPRVFLLYAIGAFLMLGYAWHGACAEADNPSMRGSCSGAIALAWPAIAVFVASIKLMDPANLSIPKIRIDW